MVVLINLQAKGVNMSKGRMFFLVLFIAVAFPFSSQAYVDPSVMSYTVQAVAGTLIGIGAVAGIVWRIVRKKTEFMIKSDTESPKEIEPDIVIADNDAK